MHQGRPNCDGPGRNVDSREDILSARTFSYILASLSVYSYWKQAKLEAASLKETLPGRYGLMISVVDSRVYFIHQTVKEFLVEGRKSPKKEGFRMLC